MTHLLVVGGQSRLAQTAIDLFITLGHTISSFDIQDPKEGRPGVSHFEVDISALETFEPVLRKVVEKSGPVSSVLFFSRYQSKSGSFEGREDWYGSIDIGLRAPTKILQELAGLPENKGRLASAVLMGSVLGRLVSDIQTASYHSVKGATDALARYLAIRLLPNGIRVNVVAPGFVSEKQSLVSENKVKPMDALPSSVIGLVPVVTAAQLASVCHFLCSESSNGINGQTILVDGGWSNVEQLGLLLGYEGRLK